MTPAKLISLLKKQNPDLAVLPDLRQRAMLLIDSIWLRGSDHSHEDGPYFFNAGHARLLANLLRRGAL